MKRTDPPVSHPKDDEGKKLFAGKKYLQSAAAFSQAAVDFQQQGLDLMAAEMRNNQCVALIKANKSQEALDAVQGTDRVFQDEGEILKQAMALANEATALKDLGFNQKAIERFTTAAAIFDQIDERDMYLQTMQSISGLKLKIRNIPGAIISLQEGLESLEKPNLRQKILLNLLKIPQNMIGE
jgi:tetratricopeptide (TPR) repeat protein